MHIAMISDYETRGGAAISASRLAEALCLTGHRVTRIVVMPEGSEHPWETAAIRIESPLRVGRHLLPGRWWGKLRSVLFKNTLRRILMNLRPDVINVHNIHGAIGAGCSPEILRVCLDHAPTVWTLHDMWSFTGGCAYSYNCQKFLTGCDASCSNPIEYGALECKWVASAWEQRQRLLDELSLVVAVTPSYWLAGEAKSGLWAGHRIEVIPYGLPLGIYRPVDRTLAREALGIETPGPVVLVGAQNLSDPRKGCTLLIEALNRVSYRPFTLVTLGSGRVHVEGDGIKVCHLGYVDHERTKVLCYSAGVFFVQTALADNLPNVLIEAIACGTPVVAFPVGGTPDVVRPGQTGWLTSEVSSSGLAHTIDKVLEETQPGASLRNSCRAVAEAEYSSDLQAQRYLSLFQSLCGKARA